MKETGKEECIVIWTQALDNSPNDQIIEMGSNSINEVQDIEKRRECVDRIGKVTQIKKNFCKINDISFFINKTELVLNIRSNQKDNKNRDVVPQLYSGFPVEEEVFVDVLKTFFNRNSWNYDCNYAEDVYSKIEEVYQSRKELRRSKIIQRILNFIRENFPFRKELRRSKIIKGIQNFIRENFHPEKS